MAATTLPNCRCRICEAAPGTELDEQEQNVVDVVERYGWMVTDIRPQAELPGWAFTTGLGHSFGWPELVMAGLNSDGLHGCLNIAGEIAREGRSIELNTTVADVLVGYDVVLRFVDVRWNQSMFGWSRWFAQHDEPIFRQVVWPDKNGRFPWDPTFNSSIAGLQPDLELAPSAHAAGPWRAWAADSAWPGRERTNGLVFASRSVVEGGAPVLALPAFYSTAEERWRACVQAFEHVVASS